MLSFVHPPPDDRVDLDGTEPGRLGGLDPLQHLRRPEAAPVHHAKDLVVQAVQADGHSHQPGLLQRLGLPRQQVAVGRHGQVVEARDCRKTGDQLLHLVADQRLPARYADLLRAQAHEDTGDPLHLLEGQQLGLGQELVPLAENLRRHAVGAAEVAPVGDRYADVAEGPAERVCDHDAFRPTFIVIRADAALRAAMPRWLTRFFSSAVSSAIVLPSSGTKNIGS